MREHKRREGKKGLEFLAAPFVFLVVEFDVLNIRYNFSNTSQQHLPVPTVAFCRGSGVRDPLLRTQ